MGIEHLKVGKIFNLNQSNGTSDIKITGASFIHAIYNIHSSLITITIDNQYVFPINGYSSSATPNFYTFPIPLAFNTIKIDTAASHAAQILYS